MTFKIYLYCYFTLLTLFCIYILQTSAENKKLRMSEYPTKFVGFYMGKKNYAEVSKTTWSMVKWNFFLIWAKLRKYGKVFFFGIWVFRFIDSGIARLATAAFSLWMFRAWDCLHRGSSYPGYLSLCPMLYLIYMIMFWPVLVSEYPVVTISLYVCLSFLHFITPLAPRHMESLILPPSIYCIYFVWLLIYC